MFCDYKNKVYTLSYNLATLRLGVPLPLVDFVGFNMEDEPLMRIKRHPFQVPMARAIT